jgi:hypothetical protein
MLNMNSPLPHPAFHVTEYSTPAVLPEYRIGWIQGHKEQRLCWRARAPRV